METATEEQRVTIDPISEHDDAGMSTQPPEPEEQPKAKREVKKTPRIVLACDRHADAEAWTVIGIFDGTEREAKKQALQGSDVLKGLYADKRLSLVAPPARGWNVTSPEPEERIRGL